MPRAVLKNGVIYPVEPLPSDWSDGTELSVEKAAPPPSETRKSRTDEWMDRVEASAALIDPADDERLMEAVKAFREQDRELARRKAEQAK